MILISGFQPFSVWTNNTSEVAALAAAEVDDRVRAMILPVCYDRAAELLVEEIMALRPHLAISLGMAAKRTTVDIECCAHNEDNSEVADNDGVIREGAAILEGPPTLTPNFPRESLQEYLESLGYHAGISHNAGRYVCNNLFFRVSHELQRRGSETPFTFVHIPGPVDWEEDQVREFGHNLAKWALSGGKLYA